MDTLIFSFQTVLPMIIMLSIGMIIKKVKLLDKDSINKLNKLVFTVLLPLLLFKNIYEADIKSAINTRLIVFVLASILIIYFLSFLLVLPIEKSNRSRGAMIQAIFRTNFVVLGIPIVSHIFGGENLGVTCVLISIVVPLYNVLAVITLEVFRGGKPEFSHVLLGILKNPLIIGALIGILFLILNVPLPKIIITTIDEIAASATPLAVIVLGASFSFVSVKECRRNLSIVLLARLIVIPGVALSIGALLGFRGVEFASLIAIFAAPTAISSYTMAQQMDSDDVLACNTVIFTTLFSCLSIFLWVFVFKSFGAI